jgi:hypothetical protein
MRLLPTSFLSRPLFTSRKFLRVPRLTVSLLRLVAWQPRTQRTPKQTLTNRPIRNRNACRPEIEAMLCIPKHKSK